MQLHEHAHAGGAWHESSSDHGWTTHRRLFLRFGRLLLPALWALTSWESSISTWHVGINKSGEHWRHLQTCCQNFFHGAPGPAFDSVTADPSALAPRRGDVIPVSVTLDTQHQRQSLPTRAKAGIRRWFTPGIVGDSSAGAVNHPWTLGVTQHVLS